LPKKTFQLTSDLFNSLVAAEDYPEKIIDILDLSSREISIFLEKSSLSQEDSEALLQLRKLATKQENRKLPVRRKLRDLVIEKRRTPLRSDVKASIFISHCPEDAAIASVLNKAFRSWEVPKELIFQSSDSRHGTNIGEGLSSELQKAASTARLFLLIYTHPELDWPYCFYEMGLATHPLTPNTRIVVLQCTDKQPPAVVQDLLRVEITGQDILRFTEQFHQEKGFFLSGEKAYRAHLGPDVIKERADKLYADLTGALKEILPNTKDQYRWDCFTLKLDGTVVAKINQNQSPLPNSNELGEVENGLVISRQFGNAIRHFNFHHFQEGKKLKAYISRWQAEVPDAPTLWISSLLKEIWRAVRNLPAEPGFTFLKCASSKPASWYIPIVNHARNLSQNAMEFDVYLYESITPTEETLKTVPLELSENVSQT
jgi:hypothetical protein